jgi:predicted type IV restriction endonuclease
MSEINKEKLWQFLLTLCKIIERYKGKGISKADTCAKLVEPLFENLGWDIRGEEVVRAYTIRANWKPVDYLFIVGDEPCLLIETTRLDDPLTMEDARQLTDYGSTLGVNWCVLTNGNEMKIYNSGWPEVVEKKLFFEIMIENFQKEEDNFFQMIRLLSKEGMENKELEKEGAREYAKRVILELWGDERTIRFLCNEAKLKKVKEEDIREVIKELELNELFPFPARVPEEMGIPEKEVIVEEKVPLEEEVAAPKEKIISREEEVPIEKEVFPPPTEEKEIIEEFSEKYFQEDVIKEAFKKVVENVKKLGKNIVEEPRKKGIWYKVKDKVFIKLKPHKDYFEIEILNPATGGWLSYDVDKARLNRLKDRINKAKSVYKEMSKK